jgi:peptidyl-prolyl cis-trans isomerase C
MKKLALKKILIVFVSLLLVAIIACNKTEESKKEIAGATIGTSQPQAAATVATSIVNPPVLDTKTTQPTDIAVSVDGKELKKAELEKRLKEKMNLYKDKIPTDKQKEARDAIKKQLIEEFVLRTLLVNEVNRQKVEATDKEIKADTDQIKASLPPNKKLEDFLKENNIPKEDIALGIKVKKLVALELGKNAKPTKKEISKFYDDNKDKFSTPENVHVRHILVTIDQADDDKIKAEKKEKIEKLRKQLVDGADFAEIARINSDCPSKEKGGDLGIIKKNQTVKEFEEAAFSQEKNVIGPVVKTEFGYHIIQVIDHQQAKMTPLADVQGKISSYLEQQKQTEAFGKLIQKLRKQAIIMTYEN